MQQLFRCGRRRSSLQTRGQRQAGGKPFCLPMRPTPHSLAPTRRGGQAAAQVQVRAAHVRSTAQHPPSNVGTRTALWSPPAVRNLLSAARRLYSRVFAANVPHLLQPRKHTHAPNTGQEVSYHATTYHCPPPIPLHPYPNKDVPGGTQVSPPALAHVRCAATAGIVQNHSPTCRCMLGSSSDSGGR